MEQLFNYRNIKQEHKEAAEEISNILSETGHPELAVLIKQRFDVIEKNYFSLENSIAFQKCCQHNINCAVQGHVLENGVHYPVVTICEDIRKLDQFIQNINNE